MISAFATQISIALIIAAALLTQGRAAEIEGGKCGLLLVGVIEPGDDEKFRSAVLEQLNSGCNSLSLYVYSSGGNLGTALKIAHQVNVLQMKTLAPELDGQRVRDFPLPRDGPRFCPRLPGESERYERELQFSKLYYENTLVEAWRTNKPAPPNPARFWTFDPKSGQGDERCVCASACFFIWAAGAEREGDVIQIHRPYFDPEVFGQMDIAQARAAYQALLVEARSFLLSVEVPQTIIGRMFSVGSNEASYLTPEELAGLEMAPYFAELKTARCGPKPVKEPDPADADHRPVLPATKKNPYPNLRPSTRSYLIKLAKRELCWQKSQKEIRASIVAEYLKPIRPLGRFLREPLMPPGAR